jgi:hypothetical protein
MPSRSISDGGGGGSGGAGAVLARVPAGVAAGGFIIHPLLSHLPINF